MKTILIKRSQGQQAHTDYYKKLAATKFGVPYEKVTNEMRATVKTIELAKMYSFQHPSDFYTSYFKEVFRDQDGHAKTERQVGMCAALGMGHGVNK